MVVVKKSCAASLGMGDSASEAAAGTATTTTKLGRPESCLQRGSALTSSSSSSLFARGAKVLVRRASFFSGHTVAASSSSSLYKPFQRPMLKRRAYGKVQEEALLNSSLGQRRRFDGMQRLLQRAGRGLHAKPLSSSASKKAKDGDGTTSEDDSEDEEEEDAPFEPLLLWTSPHQGGEPRGLPTQTYVSVILAIGGTVPTVRGLLGFHFLASFEIDPMPSSLITDNPFFRDFV
jgi:hypothetical protein